MKKFFREHGIWVLFATAVIAVSLSLMSFFSNTSSPLSNLAGIIASPFRSAYTAVTGWITDKQNYYQDVTALEEENAALLLQLKDFSKVQEEYLRIAPTEEEQAQGDILEVLQLIDGVIRPSAQVKQVSVSENKVLLTFSGVTLGESAQLVSLLEQSPLVTGASVDTAVSREEDQGLSEVHVYFEMNVEKEVQP